MSLQQRFINIPKGLSDALGKPDNLIPTDRDRNEKENLEGLSPGLRKDMEDLGIDSIAQLDELEEKNMSSYNEHGMIPPDDAGSFEKPILIPSRLKARCVGYVDPVTHATFWFNIRNDDCHYYIKDLGLFFKMMHIDDPEFAATAH